MSNKRFKASTRMTSVLAEIDRLIEELSIACKYLKSESRSGLVNLKRALRRAKRLRNQIRRKHKKPLRLSELFDGICFIAEVAKRIYSLLNCMKAHGDYGVCWDYYKIIKNYRRPFADCIGQQAWNI